MMNEFHFGKYKTEAYISRPHRNEVTFHMNICPWSIKKCSLEVSYLSMFIQKKLQSQTFAIGKSKIRNQNSWFIEKPKRPKIQKKQNSWIICKLKEQIKILDSLASPKNKSKFLNYRQDLRTNQNSCFISKPKEQIKILASLLASLKNKSKFSNHWQDQRTDQNSLFISKSKEQIKILKSLASSKNK